MPLNLAYLGSAGRGALWTRIATKPHRLVLAGVLCTLSFLAFLGALAEQGAGLVLTVRNTSVLFAQGLAWAIGDRPTRHQLAGPFLVASGAVLLGWPR